MESGSRPGDGEVIDAQGRRIGAGAEFEVASGDHAPEHVVEVAGDGHLADRKDDLAVLDPEPGGAAAVIAGQAVDPHAHQFGDVKSALDVRDELSGAKRA